MPAKDLFYKTVEAFHQAIGQYIHYRMVLKHQRLDRIPYLAVPNTIYQQSIFSR